MKDARIVDPRLSALAGLSESMQGAEQVATETGLCIGGSSRIVMAILHEALAIAEEHSASEAAGAVDLAVRMLSFFTAAWTPSRAHLALDQVAIAAVAEAIKDAVEAGA